MTQTETTQADLSSEFSIESTESISRYVVVGVYQNRYGIGTDSTVELMGADAAQVTRVPHSPEFISGVINHRGSIIPVVSTRRLLGFETNSSESNGTIELLGAFETEIVGWMNELSSNLECNEAFAGSRKPEDSQLGKWINELSASDEHLRSFTKGDASLKGCFDYIQEAHRRIYANANKALELRHENPELAFAGLNETWGSDLETMKTHFEKTRAAINKGQVSMMIITEFGSRKAALLVDEVFTVKDVPDSEIETLPESADNQQFLRGLVHEPDGSYILITDLAAVYDTACPSDLAADL